jgi:hypothetical protein
MNFGGHGLIAWTNAGCVYREDKSMLLAWHASWSTVQVLRASPEFIKMVLMSCIVACPPVFSNLARKSGG